MKIDNSNFGIGFGQFKGDIDKITEVDIPFGEYLKNSINNVNNLQIEADKLSQKLVTGEVADLHQVMIASEKASIAMQFAVQVRNKLVEAYQEIMRMQM